MKVSEVIELALRHHYGQGPLRNYYMCICLDNLRNDRAITEADHIYTEMHVLILLSHIYPQRTIKHGTLVSTLAAAGFIDDMMLAKNIDYTRQLYIWWAFDLRRKGE